MNILCRSSLARSLVSAPCSARSYATRGRRPKPGTSERPAYHAPDPLINNPDAVVTSLHDENLTFIHRPPPTAPSPFSLTTAPSSPLLRPPTVSEAPRPPLARNMQTPPARMTDAAIIKMKDLRQTDATKYTQGKLAKMFKCTPHFVSLVAALKKPVRKERLQVRNDEHAKMRGKWSEKHTTVKAIQSKRRELW